MKLADVLSKVGTKENSSSVEDKSAELLEAVKFLDLEAVEPAPAVESATDGFTPTGQAKTASRDSTCCRCGMRINKGQRVVGLLSNTSGWTSWVHPVCEHRTSTGSASQEVGSQVDSEVVARIAEEVAKDLDDTLETRLQHKLNEMASRVEELAEAQRVVIEICLPDKTVELDDEFLHPAFKEVVMLAASGQPVFIPGPTGSGKSHLARQVAKALGRKFGSLSFSGGTTESALIGRMVPYGEQGQFEYLGTEFLDCYENGGVFLADEFDAADPNVLIAINSALANGFISVPARHGNPQAKMHKDFAIIAAANTFGHGADRLYTARAELDESTLDRFRLGTVAVDYDRKLEAKLCPNDSLRNRLEGYRRKIADNRIERVVSTRFFRDAYLAYKRWEADRETYGYQNFNDYVDAKLFGGWSDREVTLVRGSQVKKVSE